MGAIVGIDSGTHIAERLLDLAGDSGVDHADVRVTHSRYGSISTRDHDVESVDDEERFGIGVRVIVDGAWGFAATSGRSVSDPSALFGRAAAMARANARLAPSPVYLAPEATHVGSWTGDGQIDPFTVPIGQRIELIRDRSNQLLQASVIAHVDAYVQYVREATDYYDLHGTRTQQSRLRIGGDWSATAIDDTRGAFDTLRTNAPPSARGWEYLLGTGSSLGSAKQWDWTAEIEELPEHLAQRLKAPSVEPGEYTLVLDPTNLWLTIHESVGHATELDRALGYEANYAGTTFVRPDDVGGLRYGSDVMNVMADRTAAYGLATIGWDDEGVAAQRWSLIENGVLTGLQTDRAMAAELNLGRSRGCSYADSAEHMAISRMPNVSLLPDPNGLSTEDLIAGVSDGIYIVGDRSWSIDMQRFNFQFTGQRFYRISNGRIVGQVKDVAYQSSTPRFWNSLIAVGGPDTELLCGALNCGKGQPGQVAPVSHGAPSAVFEQIRVLNTAGGE